MIVVDSGNRIFEEYFRLRAFQEFDRNLIHTKYKQIVEKLETGNRR